MEIPSNNQDIIIWDGKNQNGRLLNKGIYFVIPDKKEKVVKKLVLL